MSVQTPVKQSTCVRHSLVTHDWWDIWYCKMFRQVAGSIVLIGKGAYGDLALEHGSRLPCCDSMGLPLRPNERK